MLDVRAMWSSGMSKVMAPQNQVHANEEADEAQRRGGTPVGDVPPRTRACVCGTLRSVTLRPRAGVPALEAELWDGTGSLHVVWLGRRRIAGVEAGRRLRVKGLITRSNGEPVIYNPMYELLPRACD